MPALAGQELDDQAAAVAELRAFGELGGGTVVQWTPYGLGRRGDVLAAVSEAAGVHVIAATGLHQAQQYDPAVIERIQDRLAEVFVTELTEGLPGNGPKAGMIKVAGGFHGLDDYTRRVMTAAAEAHHASGATIGVHLELGTAALDVVDLLCTRLKVSADRVILGHLNRSPDQRMHREAAESGVFLAFDGPSRANHATDWRLLDVLAALVEGGHEDQLLLGGDTTTAAARAATGGGPGIPYLLRTLRPRLEREVGPDATAKAFVDNPARAFSWVTP